MIRSVNDSIPLKQTAKVIIHLISLTRNGWSWLSRKVLIENSFQFSLTILTIWSTVWIGIHPRTSLLNFIFAIFGAFGSYKHRVSYFENVCSLLYRFFCTTFSPRHYYFLKTRRINFCYTNSILTFCSNIWLNQHEQDIYWTEASGFVYMWAPPQHSLHSHSV